MAHIAARLATLPPADVAAHRDDLLAAQSALRHCERLGHTVIALNDVYASRRGYGPTGHFMTSDAAGVLQARG